MASPVSPDACPPEKRPGVDLSPNYSCSSPSLSRLTYISINDGTALPTPDKPKVWKDGNTLLPIHKYHDELSHFRFEKKVTK